jgi:hypothetical protein
MSATIISYIPGAGGNHLKNLMCTYSGFANSNELNVDVYNEQTQPPGTAHSVPGRNLHDQVIDRAVNSPDQHWLMLGHFGELALWREQINSISNKKWILITLNTQLDRNLLETRHERLQQHIHPYWLNEEQLYLYQPAIYHSYFPGHTDNVLTISLKEFWNPKVDTVIGKINKFLDIDIPVEPVQQLHDLWWKYNFFFPWSSTVREYYNVDMPNTNE